MPLERKKMTEYPKIENPEFVDVQKTRVRFLLVKENGSKTMAELKVPDGEALGVNEHWDRIVNEFDIESMKKRRDDIEKKIKIEQSLSEKKKRAANDNRILQSLFDKKLKFFNLHFIKDLTPEEKSAIRRASDENFLTIAIIEAVQNYIKRSGKTLLELFDEIEDEEYKKLDDKK